MDFNGFVVRPAPNTFVPLARQQRIGDILERCDLPHRAPPSAEIVALIEGDIAPGTPLVDAHRIWQPQRIAHLTTPDGFPRQPEDAPCPRGIVRVCVECVERRTGGMGSHFGFDGYILSLLVDIDHGTIWDARREPVH